MTISANQYLLAGCAGFAPVQAIGSHDAVLAEERRPDGFQKFNLANNAIAPTPLARPPGAGADAKLVQPDGIAPFEFFGIGEFGVGHVLMHRRATVVPNRRARGPANSFIITKISPTKQKIIHRSLTARS